MQVPVPLYLGVLEGLRVASTPDSQVIVCNRRVEVHGHVHVLEVPLAGRVPELPAHTNIGR
jgi:hypothetical protein